MDVGFVILLLVPVLCAVFFVFTKSFGLRSLLLSFMILVQSSSLLIGRSSARRTAKGKFRNEETLNMANLSLLKQYDILLSELDKRQFWVDIMPLASCSILLVIMSVIERRNDKIIHAVNEKEEKVSSRQDKSGVPE